MKLSIASVDTGTAIARSMAYECAVAARVERNETHKASATPTPLFAVVMSDTDSDLSGEVLAPTSAPRPAGYTQHVYCGAQGDAERRAWREDYVSNRWAR